MKKILAVIVLFCMMLTLVACGDVSDVEVIEWQPSEIYTDSEINSAISVVKTYFRTTFDGCTLTEISYPGDEASEEFKEWAEQYGADEAIVLYSSFDVGSSGGDGSFEPNSTYENWKWVLVRNEGGPWEHKTHGYG